MLDMSPRQILLNTSHTHAGPMLGMGTWAYADYIEPDRLYLLDLEKAIVRAASQAKEAAREVKLYAGKARTTLPVKRRKLDEHGRAQWIPNPEGTIHDSTPFCLFRDKHGKPVCLMFAVSCHPSTIRSTEISADYPGVAMKLLDQHLGAECSLFLQGAGGDAKPLFSAKADRFYGDWDDVRKGGELVARELIEGMKGALVEISPIIRSGVIEMQFPLKPSTGRAEYANVAADQNAAEYIRLWAKRQVERLDRGETLMTHAPIIMHGLQLGDKLRLLGIEAEAVAEIGILIDKFFGKDITFSMGYTDGTQLYLPTSQMIEKEGGYEVDSYAEYGFPSGLAGRVEEILTESLKKVF
jgi:hypothetical protein